jgi:N-acetylmuramoyl-L-alanine amidase
MSYSLDQVYELFLLALCVWREARGESLDAKRGVAWVVRNRAAHPSWWGTDSVTVILKPAQFSSFNAGDPNSVKWPAQNDLSWVAALEISAEVLAGRTEDPTGGATFYFDDSLAANPPAWAAQLEPCAKLGRLNFFRKPS